MAGITSAAPRPSTSDQPISSIARFCESAVISEPTPYTTMPIANARLRPHTSPSLPPVSMNAAIDSA